MRQQEPRQPKPRRYSLDASALKKCLLNKYGSINEILRVSGKMAPGLIPSRPLINQWFQGKSDPSLKYAFLIEDLTGYPISHFRMGGNNAA